MSRGTPPSGEVAALLRTTGGTWRGGVSCLDTQGGIAAHPHTSHLPPHTLHTSHPHTSIHPRSNPIPNPHTVTPLPTPCGTVPSLVRRCRATLAGSAGPCGGGGAAGRGRASTVAAGNRSCGRARSDGGARRTCMRGGERGGGWIRAAAAGNKRCRCTGMQWRWSAGNLR